VKYFFVLTQTFVNSSSVHRPRYITTTFEINTGLMSSQAGGILKDLLLAVLSASASRHWNYL